MNPGAELCGTTDGSVRTAIYLAPLAMAAVFNLNHHATYVHWHFINLSLSNVIVIAVMLAVFVLAIALPFPGRHTTGAAIAPPPPSEG